MKLFGDNNSSYSHSNHNNRNKRGPISRIKTKSTNNNQQHHQNTNYSFNRQYQSNNINTKNVEPFLRFRCEEYLKNHDNETALFFAERLLSERDNLSNRLLVAKCYKELNQYNRAYHVLFRVLRQKQTNYQRYLEERIKYENSMNHLEATGHDISFGIDPLTPTTIDNSGNISGIGFAFNTTMMNDVNRNNNNNNSNNKIDVFGGPAFMTKTPKIKEMINNKNKKTYLKDMDEPSDDQIEILNESRYFVSLICFELGRYDECEEFLLGKKWSNSRNLELKIPNGVHGIYLMAKVFHKSSRFDLAIDFYRKCIEIDSYHFGAIMALSELGKDPGLTKQSASKQALQSKHCLVPIKDDNKNNNEEEIKLVELEKMDIESYKKLKSLFDNLCWGYFKLQMFYPQDALKYFNKLPSSHFTSAWVLNNTARCYYEMNDYSRAIINWSKQVDLYPYDMKGMDYYSTALWHLKKSKELTLLSQRCSEIDKTSAATWMVMGNCFSLHKSHDLAIKFFKKAYCISTNYAYAYTLAGHEYVVNEDFDSALKSFQSALRIDYRHYNAWYGLGNIYQFQQNYKKALYHFIKAKEINPNSSVLFVCISNIYKLQSNYKFALQFVNKALSLSNATGHHNLKARLEKAQIYILMNEYKNAINEFKHLLQIIPNEWKVHFHLGEVYLQIGNKDEALLSFNRAMSLNPKDKNTIKHAIQNVYNNQNQTYQHNERNNNNNNNNRNNEVYQSILVEQDDQDIDDEDDDDDDDDDDGNYRSNGNEHNNMRMNHEIDDDDDDDDMLDESVDDNDEFMNISGSNDRSSVNAIGPSHSNSLSPH